jgi:predicted DNA binding CopG/RHH family protein
MKNKKLKKLPTFKTDKEAADFVDHADLSEYDLSHSTIVQFKFEQKSAYLNMRLSESLLAAVKKTAEKRGIPYQRFVREALEKAVAV